mmetsp:Transcript_1334/g.4024  ORF Transcript_1334/g.4024 Transcript_1334/m.4024 type:complete len:468 (+) Transcript_1334:164-1567(+)
MPRAGARSESCLKSSQLCFLGSWNAERAHNRHRRQRMRSVPNAVRPTAHFALGIDFGTSGVRAAVVDIETGFVKKVVEGVQVQGEHCEASWEEALRKIVQSVPDELRENVHRVCVDGTSASVLLNGKVKLYNYGEPPEVVEKIRKVAPAGHTAASATSALAKLVSWGGKGSVEHQTDFLTRLLLASSERLSDWHNALKMGFDPGAEEWPLWLQDLVSKDALMDVVRPGTLLGNAESSFGLSRSCQVVAGTTDSIAAFIASGACDVGAACTSLGSSLAIKLLSDVRIDESSLGIYSHRHFMDGPQGNPQWLIGGASNTGGRTLLEVGFSKDELARLSNEMDLTVPVSKLDLYPLPPNSVGERFPVNDPNLLPRLGRKDSTDVDYLRALLESIAEIETRGYMKLHELGGPYPSVVYSAGGGAFNDTYTAIRQRRLQVPVKKGRSTDACVGAAMLAMAGSKTNGTRRAQG